MKKFLSAFVLILLCCMALLTACKGATLDMPTTDATVIGNGGVAVVKGDYLYFLNGYVDSSQFTDYKKDNVFGKVTRGAIYRTKLDKNASIQKDELGFLKNSDVVVPKVVGFSEGGFYIMGDYIYYITPHMREDKDGFLKSKLLDFCRIKLDGTGNQVLHTSETDLIDNFTITDNSDSTQINWNVYNYKSGVYVVYFENSKLISIKAQKDPKVTVMAEDVSSVALPAAPREFRYGVDQLTESQAKFFITKTGTDILGNVLARVELGTKNVEEIRLNSTDYTYTLTGVYGDYVYFNRVNAKTNGIKTLWRAKINSPAIHYQITIASYDKVFVNVINQNYVLAVSGSNVYRVNANDIQGEKVNNEELLLFAGNNITVLEVQGDYLYFVKDSHVHRIYINTTELQTESQQITTIDKTYGVKNVLVDIDDARYVYIFAKYESGKDSSKTSFYLNVIDTFDNKKASRFVGVFEENDKPARPEDDEGTEDVDESTPWLV